MDDECIKIIFYSFQSINNHRICFYIKDLFETYQICTNEQYPFVYHHIGSCILSIEPEFIWILIEYNIQIEKFKKGKEMKLNLFVISIYFLFSENN